MLFKNYDIVLTKSLQTYSLQSVQIHVERISSEEGVELDVEKTGKLLKNFLSLDIVKFKINELNLPIEITGAIDKFKSLESPVEGEIEDLVSTLTFFGYNLYIVGRIDLNDTPIEYNPDYDMKTYLINNYQFNKTGVSCVYSGYARLYEMGSVPTAFEYLQVFGLSSEQYNMFELDTARTSYDLMSSKGDLRNFDDTIPLEFVTSRGYRFLTIINQA